MPVLRLGHVSDDEGRMGRMRTRGLVLMVLDVLLWPSQSEAKPRAKMNSVQRKKWCQVRSNGFPLFLSLKLDVSSKMTCQLGASHMHGMLSGEIQSSLKRYPEKYTQSDDLMTCDESVCTYQYFTYCIYIYFLHAICNMRFATFETLKYDPLTSWSYGPSWLAVFRERGLFQSINEDTLKIWMEMAVNVLLFNILECNLWSSPSVFFMHSNVQKYNYNLGNAFHSSSLELRNRMPPTLSRWLWQRRPKRSEKRELLAACVFSRRLEDRSQPLSH